MDEVVEVKVFDKKTGHLVFEGNVCTDVLPHQLAHLRCFYEKDLRGLYDQVTNTHVQSFKGLKWAHLVATSGMFWSFVGVLYIDAKGVVRCSKVVPACECKMMSLWDIPRKECENVFRCNSFEELEELEIHRCDLSHIPSDIGRMKSLTKLMLQGLDGLQVLPDEIGQLSSLRELVIGFGEIDSLPKSIGGLRQLEKLKLSSLYELEHFPEEMGQMSSLKELVVGYCALKSLPKSLKELNSLKSLHLTRCLSLELCENDIMAVLPKLKHLRVNGCERWLPSSNTLNAFCDMLRTNVNLKSLSLDWNDSNDHIAAMLTAALRENGSIVEGMIYRIPESEQIFKRNKENRQKALQSVYCIITIRKYKNALNDKPKEMVVMIAKMLWMTRCDIEAWKRDELQ